MLSYYLRVTKDKKYICLTEVPLRYYIASRIADEVCSLTGHRLCESHEILFATKNADKFLSIWHGLLEAEHEHGKDWLTFELSDEEFSKFECG